MPEQLRNAISRRRFLKTTGTAALAAGTGPAVIIPGRAQPKVLKILRAVAFVPSYIPWFESFAKTWGEKNNIKVILDWANWAEEDKIEQEEIAVQKGHDLFDSINAPEDQVIDHREIYEECERRYGKPLDAIKRNAYNPKTQKYVTFDLHYLALPLIYRKDLWDRVGRMPDSWDDVRYGGREISFLHNHPVGIGFGPNQVSELGLRTLLLSFGGSVQNADNQPALKSAATLEALKFGKALYQEAMAEETLSWDSVVSNKRYMLSGESCLTLNSISLTRSAENTNLPVANQLALAKTPAGPAGRNGIWSGTRRFLIWKFADNIDAAKQFLVDYVGASREAMLASKFYLLPAYPQTVPDLQQLLSNDTSATPRDKYQILADPGNWTNNSAFPGYSNPANSEVFANWVISQMFANSASGKMTPDEAMNQADQEVRKIYDKWRALGKV